MPRFSIIIPCYNSGRWIRQALDSVFDQPGDDFEVIAVDDGSTDDTLAALNAYGRGVRVFSQKHQGAGVARNLAISKATGDYVATLDADDVWFPWTLGLCRESIARFDQPSIIAGTALRFERSAELARVTVPEPTDVQQYPNFYEAARDGFWFLLQGALVLRQDVFQTCGGYADRKINSEDTHFFMKFGALSGFTVIRSPPMFGYRMHGGNAILDASLNQAGCLFLIGQEKSGAYPGGVAMKDIRRTILAIQARAASVACLKAGDVSKGLKIYTATFWWNLALGRLKYLIGFPIYLILATGRKKPRQN